MNVNLRIHARTENALTQKEATNAPVQQALTVTAKQKIAQKIFPILLAWLPVSIRFVF